MLNESLEFLVAAPAGRYLDGTLGRGGHSRALLERFPEATVVGCDRDEAALRRVAEELPTELAPRLELKQLSFSQLATLGGGFDGLLLDLGLSSEQLSDDERGFSFRFDGPLDMRMDQSAPTTAAKLVNETPEADLANLIYRYGDVRRSRAVARAIVKSRPLRTTFELAEVVRRVVRRSGKIDPATRTFQALRMAVNGEIDELNAILTTSLTLLKPAGRLVLISYHSGEDRLVKRFLRRMSGGCVCPPGTPVCLCEPQEEFKLLTRRPVIAADAEIKANPRARSAKLRAGERLP
ncbi:16S rRNA (cytosine(1402)-N(4))-methyltransferase RsmH [bacterium]|nr:16S rRNA (cytosine(1402)-N(4))-methyltransferase RsmH [bacterium]